MSKTFLRFFIVGMLGLFFDWTVYLSVIKFANFDIILSRLIATSLAVIVTWLFNRFYSFGYRYVKVSLIEFIYYAASSSVGAFANFFLFIALVDFENNKFRPISYCLSAALGMLVNYLLYKKKVFAKRSQDSEKNVKKNNN